MKDIFTCICGEKKVRVRGVGMKCISNTCKESTPVCDISKKDVSKQLKELDETTSSKLIQASKKYPKMCKQYLVELRKVITWAENKLFKINEK